MNSSLKQDGRKLLLGPKNQLGKKCGCYGVKVTTHSLAEFVECMHLHGLAHNPTIYDYFLLGCDTTQSGRSLTSVFETASSSGRTVSQAWKKLMQI